MRLYLHIGTHKTGTTALQVFASKNLEWLKQKGLLYPTPILIGKSRSQSQWPLVNNLTGASGDARYNEGLAILRSARRSAIESKINIFMSAENLYRLTVQSRRNVIRALNEVFSEDHITVVCALRSQAEFAESYYKNSYRTYKNRPLALDSWLTKFSPLFEYKTRIKGFSEPLSADLLLVPYHKAARKTFISDFFRRLGVDTLEGSEDPENKNMSLDTVDCIAKETIIKDDVSSSRVRSFNNFAAQNKISTDYGFIYKSFEKSFAKKFARENSELIRLEPSLEQSIGTSAPKMKKRQMDSEFDEIVKNRIASFYIWEEKRRGRN